MLGLGVVGAGVGIGALAGRHMQNVELERLQEEAAKIEQHLMSVKAERDTGRSRLEFKLEELQSNMTNLSQSTDSGIYRINMWFDNQRRLI